MHTVLVVLSISIAVVNLWELAAKWDDLALEHTELYRRFSELLTQMAKAVNPNDEMIHAWLAEAADIRKDEPPTMWAVYAMCWNQIAERHHGREASKFYRVVSFTWHLFGNVFQFRPQDFPQAS